MQWLDVNKFQMPLDTKLILRFKNIDGEIGVTMGDVTNIETELYQYHIDFDVYRSNNWKLTHFCIPDAVEKENK